ncbi:MAG: hypothetical protein INR72_20610 [Williamsia herbipolensis]|nr:hypothetical protein [Williamsia herbipolensis]
MRTAHQVWCGIAAVTFVIVAAVDLGGTSSSSPRTPAVASAPVVDASGYGPDGSYGSGYGAPGVATSPQSSGGASGTSVFGVGRRTVTVTDVVDGDTFEIAGGERVRVLGIDSCESGTVEGATATARAREALTATGDQPISLTSEPGVDRDRNGRLLRYVQTAGVDFGTFMVMYPDTEVYQGNNDASPSYVSTLRANDDGPRTCTAPPTTSADPPPSGDDDDRDRRSVPEPSYSGDEDGGGLRRHTGSTGHPCLPGERDGDKDGYCGEGR